MRHASDVTAFSEFVEARSASLFRTAYLMVGDHQLAQDLLQEALVKTLIAWPRLRDHANVEAYTRRIVVTTSISWRRRRVLPRAADRQPARDRSARTPSTAIVTHDAVIAALLDRATPPAGRDRAALLPGPHRGPDRRGHGLLGRHGQEPGRGGVEEAARAAGRSFDEPSRVNGRRPHERVPGRPAAPQRRRTCPSPASTSMSWWPQAGRRQRRRRLAVVAGPPPPSSVRSWSGSFVVRGGSAAGSRAGAVPSPPAPAASPRTRPDASARVRRRARRCTSATRPSTPAAPWCSSTPPTTAWCS